MYVLDLESHVYSAHGYIDWLDCHARLRISDVVQLFFMAVMSVNATCTRDQSCS